MKLDKIFVTLFVGLAMTACSNDEEMITGGNQLPVDGKAAYMSLSLAMPKSSGTRAPGENHGTANEQKVNELYLVLFDASDICLETKILSATDYILNVGGADVTGYNGKAFKVWAGYQGGGTVMESRPAGTFDPGHHQLRHSRT